MVGTENDLPSITHLRRQAQLCLSSHCAQREKPMPPLGMEAETMIRERASSGAPGTLDHLSDCIEEIASTRHQHKSWCCVFHYPFCVSHRSVCVRPLQLKPIANKSVEKQQKSVPICIFIFLPMIPRIENLGCWY